MKINLVLPKIQKVIKRVCPDVKIEKQGNQYFRKIQGIDPETGAFAKLKVWHNGSWNLQLKKNRAYIDFTLGEFKLNGCKYKYGGYSELEKSKGNSFDEIKALIKDHFGIAKDYVTRKRAMQKKVQMLVNRK